MNPINKQRTLGQGFGPGYHFNLFLNEEIYKPLINGQYVINILNTANQASSIGDVESGNPVIDRRSLALHLPDLLVDLDITRLVKILPSALARLSDSHKALFANETLFDALDKRFINSLAQSIPAEKRPITSSQWVQMLSKESLTNVDPYLLAYLIPALLDRMNENERMEISEELAKGLAQKDFRAITVPNYFQVRFQEMPQKLSLKNNGRALIFKADQVAKTTALFRGKAWELDHTHIHLHASNLPKEALAMDAEDARKEEREYKFYETRAQYEASLKNPESDPNLKIVGEVHTVFKRAAGKDKSKVKFMAVGRPLMLGKEANQDIQNILNLVKVEKIEPSASEVSVPMEMLFREVFLKDFSPEEVIYHSWGSLYATSHAFRSGLRFNMMRKPLLVSAVQYNALKTLFGDLQELDPVNALYPIDRKADHRKQIGKLSRQEP
jgi:hypothetical protein